MTTASKQEDAVEWLQKQVSAGRFLHIQGVVKTAVRLASRYGVSTEKTAWAAWLHDCAKELPHGRMKSWIEGGPFKLDPEEKALPELWHPHASAAIARSKWGIDDPEVLEAIRCHTLGKPGMGPVAQAVFVADFIEPGRDFPGVEKARRSARTGLREGVVTKASMTMGFLLNNRSKIHPRLLQTWNYFLDKRTDEKI